MEKLNLIERSFERRFVKVTKLLEDGSGKPYTRPGWSTAGSQKDVYFQLPYQHWQDGLHNQLDMPAKVVILIGMSLRKPKFPLPETKVFAGYYGISDATLRRGIERLRDVGILRHFDINTQCRWTNVTTLRGAITAAVIGGVIGTILIDGGTIRRSV